MNCFISWCLRIAVVFWKFLVPYIYILEAGNVIVSCKLYFPFEMMNFTVYLFCRAWQLRKSFHASHATLEGKYTMTYSEITLKCCKYSSHFNRFDCFIRKLVTLVHLEGKQAKGILQKSLMRLEENCLITFYPLF